MDERGFESSACSNVQGKQTFNSWRDGWVESAWRIRATLWVVSRHEERLRCKRLVFFSKPLAKARAPACNIGIGWIQ